MKFARIASGSLSPVACACGALLTIGATSPAAAQSFSSSGANNSYPTNLFPVNANARALDFGTNTVQIGSSAPGSFAAMGGSLLKAAGLQIGTGGTGSGTVAVSGAGTTVQLGGASNTNRLDVGSWGAGTLTVSGGALVDAAVNASTCANNFCNSFIGNGAGSTGTLNVTGVGSEVRTMRNFAIGQASVFTSAHDDFNFGTPGGTTQAFVNVTNGGTLRTQNASAGTGPTTAAALGTEKAFATIVVDGAGSQWIATRDPISGAAANIAVGNNAGGSGAVSIRNGGKVTIDGSGGSATSFDAMNIGVSGGVGAVTVTGPGSSLLVAGNNPFIGVGRSGQGTLSVLDGASAAAMLMSVGRDGASGTMLIDGPGSSVSLTGVGTLGTAGPAGVTVGQNGGNGQITVSHGGTLLITDGGANSNVAGSSPFFNLGRDAASTGRLTIDGARSVVRMSSTSLAPAAGAGDNYNPYMSIGRYAGSTGDLVVTNGGKLLLDGNAQSTLADPRSTTLYVGGNTDSQLANGGRGNALVSGAGSELRLTSNDSYMAVGIGTGATGSLSIADQGLVSGMLLHVGRIGTGAVSIDNATLALSGQQTGSPLGSPAGATLGVGVGGGTGSVTVTNGGKINLTNLGNLGTSVNLGGSDAYPQGSGTMTLSGASQLTLTAGSTAGIVGTAASGQATLSIGRSGTGALIATGSSNIDVGNGNVYIGRLPGATGTLQLDDGSSLKAGFVGVGATQSGNGGSGRLILNNSTLTTTTLSIGANGVLSGDGGIVKASGDVLVAGTIDPGNSPGRITIECNFVTLAGSKLILDVLDTGDGFAVDHLILGNDSTFDLGKIQLVFNFLGDTDPNVFAVSGGFSLDNFLESLDLKTGAITGLSTVFTSGETWADVIGAGHLSAISSRYDVTRLAFSADGTVTFATAPIPEPGTWVLMLAGIAAMAVTARRRRLTTMH